MSNLESISNALFQLRWVQSLGAGTEVFSHLRVSEDVLLTSGVGLHDRPVAEHALSLSLYLVRQLQKASEAFANRLWSESLGGRQPLRTLEGPITTLLESNVVIWGFGSIGTHLAHLLKGLGASVSGIARSPGVREGYNVVGPEGADALLNMADLLILVLPGDESTKRMLSRDRIYQLKPNAYVVNVGRGSTVDEQALVDALHSGRISGAALDVVSQEPLPAGSPLWSAPNLLITPHAAGGRPVGANELIESNIASLLSGRRLRNLVV